MIIYKVTNLLNGKSYIGKSVLSLERRKTRHLKDVERGSSAHFHRALRKFGNDNFKWEVIFDKCRSKSSLKRKEIFFIKKYHTVSPEGYNMTRGGDGGILRHTNATKNKMRLSKIGQNNPMYGNSHSSEVKLKMSKTRCGKGNPFYGKRHTKESLHKISLHHKGMSGKSHRNDTKVKMSLAARGENNSQNKLSVENVREIKQLIKRGKLFLREIAQKYNVSRSLINNIKHKRKWTWIK